MAFILRHINGPKRIIYSKNSDIAKIYYLLYVLKDHKKFLRIENIYKIYVGWNNEIEQLHKEKGIIIQEELPPLEEGDDGGIIMRTDYKVWDTYNIDIFSQTQSYYVNLFDTYSHIYYRLMSTIKTDGNVNDMYNMIKRIDHSQLINAYKFIIKCMTNEFTCLYFPYKKLINTQYKYILNLLIYFFLSHE